LRTLVPAFDLFFYLQPRGASVDGVQQDIPTVLGLSGGPIWAVRDIGPDALWHPSKVSKIVAIQSGEQTHGANWSRGFRWDAVLEILRQPALKLRSPP
jgi:hypothetical protein